MKLLYIGDINSGTGYSVAAKNTIRSLMTTDIDLVVRNMKLAPQYNDPGEDIKALMTKDLDGVDVVVQHILAPYFIYKGGVKNIGYFHWETDNIAPSNWHYYCDLMDEIWVSCYENLKAVKDLLPEKPVKVVPIGLDKTSFNRKDYETFFEKKDQYVFYHIGDYSERKNTYNLIKAYLEEFSIYDNVILVIKSYVEGMNGRQSHEHILNDINRIKTGLRKGNLENYPPIILITDYLTEKDIMRVHAQGDCFISLERGAAWNLPAFYACGFGNNVIVNGWGGQNQFVENGRILDYKMIPCFGMDRCPYKNLYTCYENWAEPDFEQAKQAMRSVYENRHVVPINNSNFLEKWSFENQGKKLKEILS